MRVIEILRRLVHNADATASSSHRIEQKLDALIAGSANQTDVLNRKFAEVILGLNNQSELLNRKMNQLIAAVSGQPVPLDAVPTGLQAPPTMESFPDAMQRIPLMIADRTYNTSHPEYDAHLARNFPGKIFTRDLPCGNAAYHALLPCSNGADVPP